MKTVAMLGISAFAVSLFADSARLIWTPSPTEGVTYNIYASSQVLGPGNFRGAEVVVNAGTNTAATVTGVTNGTWFFVVTASKGGSESEPVGPAEITFPSPPSFPRFAVQTNYITFTNVVNTVYFTIVFPPFTAATQAPPPRGEK